MLFSIVTAPSFTRLIPIPVDSILLFLIDVLPLTLTATELYGSKGSPVGSVPLLDPVATI